MIPSPPNTGLKHSTSSFVDPFAAAPETTSAGTTIHRAPAIAYHNSNFRDLRERNSQKHRPLVVIIPPPIILQQHGAFGHTLSSGTPQRLGQGIIMTLYPTMYGQLSAISKEFSFPSTMGLCLYLRYVENGVTLTPRISDESWPSLWVSAFEGQHLSSRMLPITGTIEFDVDIRRARWYPSWLSSSLRDASDAQQSACLYTATPEKYERNPGALDDRPIDDQRPDTGMHRHTSSVSSQRPHFPKKLSLVDRFDEMNPRPPPPPSPEKLPATLPGLSPLVQESKPQSARQDLTTRVQSWRSGAVQDLATLEIADQSSTKSPTSVEIDIPGHMDVSDLEQYDWSITSAGPEDYGSISSRDSGPPQSLRLEDRLIGSVCSTPSTRTSFGLLDHDFETPPHSPRYLLSPDLAHRVIGSTPLTPMTATSWGPPSLPPLSPWNGTYASSVDIGGRHILSPPLSASTPPTPDIGFHVFDGTAVESPLRSWAYLSPDSQRLPDNVAVKPWLYSWPYYSPNLHTHPGGAAVEPWLYSWPYYRPDRQTRISSTVPRLPVSANQNQYPFINIYPAVYPHFDLYPKLAGDVTKKLPTEHIHTPPRCEQPDGLSHPQSCQSSDIMYLSFGDEQGGFSQSRHLQNDETRTSSTRVPSYPIFNLYPAIYPYFDIYPAVIQCIVPAPSVVTSMANSFAGHARPTLTICAHEYPYFDLYPARLQDAVELTIDYTDVRLRPGYPIVDIYPAVYPHFLIYPTIPSNNTIDMTSAVDPADADMITTRLVDLHLKPVYPTFAIYPSVYPHLDIYPNILSSQPGLLVSSSVADAPAQSSPVVGAANVRLKPEYPTIIIYPAIYPYFDIYPDTYIPPLTLVTYPQFDLYPASSRSANALPPPATPILRTNPGRDDEKLHGHILNDISRKQESPLVLPVRIGSIPRDSMQFRPTAGLNSGKHSQSNVSVPDYVSIWELKSKIADSTLQRSHAAPVIIHDGR